MKNQIILVLGKRLALVCLIAIGSASSVAQAGGVYEVTRVVISPGSSRGSGGPFTVVTTTGQPSIGASSGPGYAVTGGVTPFDDETPPPSVPPAAPSALTAMAASATVIDLRWTDNSNNENGFAIEMCDTKGKCTVFTEIWRATADVISFAHTGRTPATNYTYRIRAFNSVGMSVYSNLAKARTLRR